MTPSNDHQRFKLSDLVLKVRTDVDRHVWNEERYDRFLDELCYDRDYQKEAILTVLRYVLGGQYSNLRALARENWEKNPILRERFGTWDIFERHLQLPNQLSGTVDLATATGKSYVIYGIAAILLAEGAVDRVLVLCPSTTIEEGLLNKFRSLASLDSLRDALPESAVVKIPRITTAAETITPGTICVENRDAVYEHVKSSIRSSLWGKGASVAVLNDEAHHVASEPETRVKRWKDFLQDSAYGFRVVLGFSGTCYVGNDYFTDVIYRFSLRDAMEQRFVKRVRYVADIATTGEEDELWQLVVNQHEVIRRALEPRMIRPLTIVVTPSINGCKAVAAELRDYLIQRRGVPEDVVREAVLVVYNGAPDVSRLRNVDLPTSCVEWVISVSMLNEGWDVKRVFQIVPHHKRAFDSKLLIAQVLGRGLRVPEGWRGPQAEVTVFNHAAWAESIRHLVNEVLENEKRLTSRVLADSPHHFTLHNLTYEIEKRSEEKPRQGPFEILSKGYVDLPSENPIVPVSVDFERALSEARDKWTTTVQRRTYSGEEVAAEMWNLLSYLDSESVSLGDAGGTSYAKLFPFEKLVSIVRKSLDLAGQSVCTQSNRQKLLQALGTIRRQATTVARYELSPNQLIEVPTSSRPDDHASAGQLRHDRVVFIHSDTRRLIPEEEISFYDEVAEEGGEYRRIWVPNAFDIRSPVNLVIVDASNELRFVRELIKPANGECLDAWVKSTSMGFYSIDYAWRKGEHPKRSRFNPDFFLKVASDIVVVEIKDNEEIFDPSPENVKKYQYATAHFERLNRELACNGVHVTYQFHFLSPNDYPDFFASLRSGKIHLFRSKLDVCLSGLADHMD